MRLAASPVKSEITVEVLICIESILQGRHEQNVFERVQLDVVHLNAYELDSTVPSAARDLCRDPS
jgi:hypothetical protein